MRALRPWLSSCLAVLFAFLVSLALVDERWLAAAGAAFVVTVAAALMGAAAERREPASRIWIVTVVPLLLAIGLPCSGLPLDLIFASQRGKFDAVAARLERGEYVPSPFDLGPFRIEDCDAAGGESYLWISPAAYFVNDSGQGHGSLPFRIRLDGRWTFVMED